MLTERVEDGDASYGRVFRVLDDILVVLLDPEGGGLGGGVAGWAGAGCGQWVCTVCRCVCRVKTP